MIYFKIVVVIFLFEIILAFLFSVISQLFYKKLGFDFRSIFKGLIERMFLVISLYSNYPHALTFFSAIKLATRLKHSEPEEMVDKFNDFYLIGNVISVSVAMGYVFLIKYMLINFV